MRKNKQKGLTIIEMVISTFVLAMVGLAIYSIYTYSLQVINENKAKTNAMVLANQYMEFVRNLPYDEVGLSGGIPAGQLPQSELIIINEVPFTVITRIKYHDDPFDGIGADDPLNSDYKNVYVEVSWPSRFAGNSVVLTSFVAPQGMETLDSGGTISITVFDANGQAVEGAQVRIVNNLITPAVDFTDYTDVNGLLYLPGAQPSVEGYEITATKLGSPVYSIDQTCPKSSGLPNPICPVSIPNNTPAKSHATVIDREITNISFAIDVVSTINLQTVTYEFADQWQVNTDLTNREQNTPVLALDGGDNLVFAFKDFRDTSSPRIYSQKYDLIGEKQWALDKRITSSVNSVNPDIAVDEDDNIYYAWADESMGNEDIYLIKFDADGNDLWAGAKKISTAYENFDQYYPKILYDRVSQVIYISWLDNRNSNVDIFLQKIDTDGNLIWPQEIKVNSDTGAANQSRQDMEFDSSQSVFLTWADDRISGSMDIYLQAVDNTGTKLLPSDVKVNLSSEPAIRIDPAIALDSNDFIYIAWTDDRNENFDIYWQKINSLGETQWTEDKKINDDDTMETQQTPDISIDLSNNIFVAWADSRTGNPDILMQKFDTDGTPIWDVQAKINTDYGSAVQQYPRIITRGNDQVFVAWADNRTGNFDIYAALYNGPGAVSSVAGVELEIYGSKLIGLDPIIFKYHKNFSTDSFGNLILNDMEWDSYEISLSASSPYSIIYSDQALPLNVEPGSNYSIKLYLQ